VYEAQLVQEDLDRVRVRYVPTPEFSQNDVDSLSGRLRACMGDVNVVFEEVDQIERGPNGKFRTVVCELSADKLEALRC
jgi:phenylacetate-CoA ligase